jgi:hypothetical protein
MNWLRSLVSAAAVLWVGQLPAAAQAPVGLWLGVGEITAFTSVCETKGWTGTATLVGVGYEPPSVGRNGPSTGLGITIGPFNHYSFVLPSGALNGSYQTVNVEHIGLGPQAYTAKMKVTSQQPPTITIMTDFISLVGEINGWDDIAGCVATFDIVLKFRQ